MYWSRFLTFAFLFAYLFSSQPLLRYQESEKDNYDISIDSITGEAWIDEGIPPPRVNHLSTPFYDSLSDEALWHELTQFEPIAIVGLKLPHLERGVFRSRVLLELQDIEEIRGQILNLEGIDEYTLEEEFSLPVMTDGKKYPALFVHVASIEALSTLRSLDVIDYVEPLYFFDGIGCSNPEYLGNGGDGRFTPSPGLQAPDLVPWTFSHMAIPEAWSLFNNGRGVITGAGRGITIGVLDTGIFGDQEQLRARFDLPPSGRSIVRLSVRVNPTTRCNHGTRIAGLAAAPADGTSPSAGRTIVGVAWGANLVSVKISDGVIGTPGNAAAVVAGLDLAVARRSRVITMAFGMIFSSAFISDNITRVFNDNPRVIMVAAAGTGIVSTPVFPAIMDREVIAVSIVDFSPNSNGRYQLMTFFGGYGFDQVAYGREVDFVAVASVQGAPTTGNPAEADTTTVGGSSSATAHIAGIISLMWSRQPNLSRQEVITRLAEVSSLRSIAFQQGYVNQSPEVGWGIPDAFRASGGPRTASINGPSHVNAQTQYTLTASTDGNDQFSTYLWDTGETTQSISVTAGLSGSRNHRVRITSFPNITLQAQHTVFFDGSHVRFLFSEEMVSEWASFLVGKRVDRWVNRGQQMPSGCSVISISGNEYDYINGRLQPYGFPAAFKNNGYNGFTILRPGGLSARDLTANAHVWHDGLHAVRVRIVYTIHEANGVDCNVPGLTRETP